MWSKITRHWIYAKNSLLIFSAVFFFSSLSSRELTDDDRLTLEKKNIAATTTTAAAAPVCKSRWGIFYVHRACVVFAISFWFANWELAKKKEVSQQRQKSPICTVQSRARELLYMSREMKHEYFFMLLLRSYVLFFTSRSDRFGAHTHATTRSGQESFWGGCGASNWLWIFFFSQFFISRPLLMVVARKRSWLMDTTQLSIVRCQFAVEVCGGETPAPLRIYYIAILMSINANETMKNVLNKSLCNFNFTHMPSLSAGRSSLVAVVQFSLDSIW